ncbi:MAG: type I methionyl aminopeptidase [Chthoniobacterales bacterium]|nr:type I methionyl aminopeptidase [Chthoniobacterales bacterium]MCX7713571.1 type I methionyl aminopeptidase [Chthoniobacterales bacterium]
MIPIKNEFEIGKMRRAGELAARILNQLADLVRPGITTGEIDRAAAKIMADAGVRSAFLGYGKKNNRFPGHICIGVNEVVVHGVGNERKINYGDIVKIDVGIILDGFIGDTAMTVPVGIVSPEVERLLVATEQILHGTFALARPGRHLGDICAYIEEQAVANGFSVVREFVGHGVGRRLHEEPQIPNFGRKGTGPRLRPGMTLAIEPMINMGKSDVRVLPDKWTVVTRDGLPSAHFEHTILITENEPEVLTWPRRSLLYFASSGRATVESGSERMPLRM